jgi:hypothetical protein
MGFKSRVYFFWNEGVVQMPVAAADGTSCEVPKVCAAYGRKVVAWFARRQNAQVKIPPREANSAAQIFHSEWFMLETVDAQGDGVNLIYTCTGYREYILLTPLSPDHGDTLVGYWPPFIQGSPTQNTLGPTNLDPNQIPGGSTG